MALVLADQPAVDPTADLPRLLAGLIEEADDHDGPLPTSADGPLTPAQQAYAARFGARPLLAQMAPNHRLGLATTFREGAVPAEAIPSLTSALALLERTLSPRPPRLNPRSRRTWLIAMAGVAAVVGVLAVLPRAAVVEAPATLQPDWQQVVSAPYDGVVDASSVQPGDAVVASSTVLARLMTREIELEIAAARARAANDQRDATVARAASQPAQEQLALLSAKRNEAQLALLEHRLAMSQLRSPVSGVIVSGDLRRSIGQPVMRGQTLFEIAPPAATRAEIHVLDEDVTLIAPGQAVRILPAAEPDRPRRAIVQRIRPMAEVVQGRNAFLVVAQLEPDDAPLRPGSEGVARIETGQTTWLVALLRQPVRYLRRLLWI